MYESLTSNNLHRSRLMNLRKIWLPKRPHKLTHKQRIALELRKLGVSEFAMYRMESRYLPTIIHDKEHLRGVVYGHCKVGFAMLVATDRRVIFFDKKPLFVNKDELTYDVVSGVSFSAAGLGSTVTLHTRVNDYTLRTFNRKCASTFVAYIESRRLEHLQGDARRAVTLL